MLCPLSRTITGHPRPIVKGYSLHWSAGGLVDDLEPLGDIGLPVYRLSSEKGKLMFSEQLFTRLHSRGVDVLGSLLFVLLLVGCGQQPTDPAAQPARVYFIEPQQGTSAPSPVSVVFGVENAELGAVPDKVRSSSQRLSIDSRLIEVVTPREGIVHHHLGIDTECLAPDTIVPQAPPWMDFSDASSQVGLQLPPGERTLVLQAGDDEHRTIRGLCTAITITVRDADRG